MALSIEKNDVALMVLSAKKVPDPWTNEYHRWIKHPIEIELTMNLTVYHCKSSITQQKILAANKTVKCKTRPGSTLMDSFVEKIPVTAWPIHNAKCAEQQRCWAYTH